MANKLIRKARAIIRAENEDIIVKRNRLIACESRCAPFFLHVLPAESVAVAASSLARRYVLAAAVDY